MAVNKRSNGRYQARFQVEGKRYARDFPTAREAKAWEAATKAKAAQGEAITRTKDKRRLSDLVRQWYELHGHGLKSGASRQRELLRLCEHWGDPIARTLKATDWAHFRTANMERPESPWSANTANHYQTYFSAVFAELARAGEWQSENPFKRVKKLKIAAPDTRYLEPAEITALLNACAESANAHLTAVVKLCLATGARWSEAQALRREHLRRDRVTFIDTKNHQSRTIPIEPELGDELGATGNSRGRLFNECYQAWKNAVERAELDLPKGQSSHILRHSFASYFVMNGGDLLTLQKILGHGTLDMVLRYAHLAPDHLDKARLFNPLRKNGTKVAHLRVVGG